jgi:hypothetical protein
MEVITEVAAKGTHFRTGQRLRRAVFYDDDLVVIDLDFAPVIA